MTSTAISKKQVIREINVDDIVVSFYVRKALDDDRIIFFGDLFENNVDVPPIEVNADTLEVVEGRHRLEGAKLANKKTISCWLIKFENREAMLRWALKANSGGPLPPTTDDYSHTIKMMLADGMVRKRIVEIISQATGVPPKMVVSYINNVQSDLAKKRLVQAINAVGDGQTTAKEAAEQFNVNYDTLRREISGSKKRLRKSTVGDAKSGLSVLYRSLSHKNTKCIKTIIENYEAGEISRHDVITVLDHIAQLNKRLGSTLAEKRKRFEANNP